MDEDDRWNGPAPQEWDDDGWIVYPDPTAAWAGLANEMRRRCDLFDVGKWPGEQLVTKWYPAPVTYLPDGAVRDKTGAGLNWVISVFRIKTIYYQLSTIHF